MNEHTNQWLEDAEKAQQLRELESRKKHGRKHGHDQPPSTMLSPTTLGYVGECMYKYLLHRLKVRSILNKPALAFGSAVDEGFNELLRSGGVEGDGLKAYRDKWAELVERGIEWGTGPRAWKQPEFLTAGDGIMLRLARATKDMQYEVVQHFLMRAPIVEPVTKEALEGFTLGGKLDLVDWVDLGNGKQAVVTDLKTCARLTPKADQLMHTRLSIQLLVYAYCAKADSDLFDLEGIGTVVSYLEAAKLKTTPKEGTGVQRMYADLPQELFRELFYRCKQVAQSILDAEAARALGAPLHVAYPRNLAQCDGKYGACDNLKLCRPELFEGDEPVEKNYGTNLPW